MAKYSNTVEYNIKTTLDKSGLNQLQSELIGLQTKLSSMFQQGIISQQAFNKTKKEIQEVSALLNNSFNKRLGMMDSGKLITGINQMQGGLQGVYQTFSRLGPQGTKAFNSLYKQINTVDMGMQRMSKTTDKIINTFGNTFRWGVIASVFSSIMNAAHQSVQYVKDLDESLTNIMMVSGETRDNMNEYARAANEAAKALGNTTVGMTNATQVFVQQGYDLPTSQDLAEYAVQLGNVSQQDTATASDELTAYMNAYKIDLDDIGNALSKWALVANVSAADVQELSVASQKAASAAVTTGVNMDQLAAQIATIETVTREAPENIGNGLKTLYARFSDIRMGETLEDGVDLGKVTSTLEKVGVDVLNAEGNMREVGDIMEDLMNVWDTLDLTQKNAIGQTLAGKFQYSRFSALMNRSDLYRNYLAASEGETGTETLDSMQKVYEESLQGRLNTLKSTVEGIFTKAFNTDDFYDMIDAVTKLVETFDNLIQAIGGGGNALLAFSAIATKVFSKNIGQGISNMIINRQTEMQQKGNINANQQYAQQVLAGGGVTTGSQRYDIASQNLAKINQFRSNYDYEGQIKLNQLEQEYIESLHAEEQARKELQSLIAQGAAVAGLVGDKEINSVEELISYLQELRLLGADITAQDLSNLGLDKLITKIDKARIDLAEFEQIYLEIATNPEKMAGMDAQWDEFAAKAKKAQTSLQGLIDSGALSAETLEKLTPVMRVLSEAISGDIKEWSLFEKILREAGISADELLVSLETLGKNGTLTAEQVEKAMQKVSMATANAQVNEGRIIGEATNANTQNLATQFTNLASAGMSAVFAFQSIHHIMDIINNDELTFAEKAEQLVMNFTMVAAMGIPAITQMSSAIKDIRSAYESFKITQIGNIVAEEALTAAKEQGIITTEADTVATEINTAATKTTRIEKVKQAAIEKLVSQGLDEQTAAEIVNTIATKANGVAGKELTAIEVTRIAVTKLLTLFIKEQTAALIAEKLITGPMIAIYLGIAVAIGAVIKAIQHESEIRERRKELLEEEIQKSNELINKIDESQQHLNELYNEYKETGEASDEFKQALEEQAEALDVANYQLYLQTEQYDLLVEKINEAAAATAEYNNMLLEEQNKENAENWDEETVTSDEVIGSNQNKGSNLRAQSEFSTTEQYENQVLENYAKQNELLDQINKNQEKINKTKEEIASGKYTTEEVEALNEEIEELEEENDRLLEENARIEGSRTEEDVQTYQNIQQMADNEVTSAIYRTPAMFEDQSYEDIENTLLTDSRFSKVQQSYQAIMSESGKEAADAYIAGYIEEMGVALDNEDLINQAQFEEIASERSQEYIKEREKAGISEEQAREEWDNFINDPMWDELSAEDALTVMMRIDTERSIGQMRTDVKSIIDMVQQDIDVEEAIDVQYKKPPTEITTESIQSDVLEYAEIDQEQLDQYSKEWAETTPSLVKAQEEIDAVNEGTMELQDTIYHFKDQDEFDEFCEDATVHALQTRNGIEKLNKITEETYENIANIPEQQFVSGQIDPAVMKDLDEVRDGLADTINISEEMAENLSPEWIVEHLEDIKLAAEGDVEAIARLRTAAAEEIILNLRIAGMSEEDLAIAQATLMDAHDYIASQLPNIEIGAEIDLGPYEDDLANLLAKTGWTVDQLNATVGSVEGIEYYIDTETRSAPNIESVVSAAGEASRTAGGGWAGLNAGFQTLVSWKNSGYSSVEVPVLRARKADNSSSGGNRFSAPKSSGGSKGGGGGKGGGGKGGSGKSYEAKNKDYEKKEKDRYEKVNTALDKIDSTLQNIEMDQDRLISNRWLDNLGKETDLLKEQIPWYEKKLEIQKEEAKELRDQLSADFGATFYDNGQLKNYADIFDRLENERKRLIEQYNATGDEAGQTALEKQIEDIEKKQDTFDKIYSRYDELYSKDIPDTEKALKEIQDRLEDIADEAREARREAAETLDDIRKTSEEFEQTMGNMFGQHIELDLAINSQRLEDVIGNPTAVIQDQIDRYQQMLEDSSIADEQKKWLERQIGLMNDAIANGTSILDLNLQRLKEISQYTEEWERNGFYTIDGQRSYNEDALHEMWSQALDDASNFAKELESVIQNHLDLLDDLVDNMQDAADNLEGSYDAIGDKIEYILDMNELLYGEQASQDQVDLYRQQAANDEERLKALEREKETAHIITEERRRLWEADKDNVDAQQAYYDALDNERDIDSEILDIRKDITQAYKDAEEAANELAVQDWLSNFAGTINGVEVPLEYMADQWERISENEDLYLDDLNKAYEIQKLQNEYQKMLNEATDPAIQAQITDQMNQQLEYLRDKTNLSKYDVEYANAQLEILQKTIALEDARDAKNQMKLRRDSQGNYQYVYTTNKNDVASAENDLLDASMNAYNMSKEQQGDVQDNYIKKVQDMADAMRKVMNDATLDAEQRQAIIEDIIQSGYEYLDAMSEQLSTSQRNMIESFIEAAEEMQSQNAEYVQLVADGLKEGTINTLDKIDDRFDTSVKNWIGEDGLALFRDEAENTKDDIVTNIHEFEDATNEANENLAQPLNDLETNYADVADEVARTKEEARELFDLLGSNTDVFTKAAADVAMWQSELEKSNSAIQDYKKQIKSLQDKNAALEAANTQLYSSGAADANGSGGAGLGSGAGGLAKKPGDRRAGDYTGYTGRYYENSWGEGRSGSIGSGVKGAVKISAFSAKPYGDGRYRTGEYSVHLEDLNGGYLGWIKPSQMFDTGGYTGNWNGDGRMAMLHQKELVLNATDTENILAAVDAVRLITEQLKASSFVNNIVNAVGRASQNKIQGSNVEQRVEITANFPNVNSAEEIERALLSISDTSYQYAYNKNNIPW